MSKFNFALLGCGRISARHGELLSSGAIAQAQLTAVCDILSERAEAAGRRYKVPWYTDMHAMMKAHPDIHAVNILTPSGLHAQHTLELAPYQKALIVEKPMALTLSDADAMIAACEKSKTPLFVVKQNRFNVPVVQLRNQLEAGRFGQLVMGTIRVRWSRNQSYYDQDKWRGTWALDGGAFTNQASHHVDLLRWMMGPVESVFAKADTFLVKTETEDTGIALVKFRSGALGVLEVTTAVRPKDLEGSISILGSQGTVEIGGFAVNEIRHWNFTQAQAQDELARTQFSVNPPNVYGYGHQAYLQHVVDVLDGRLQHGIDGREGRTSLELIHAIYQSIEQKREIHFPLNGESSRLGKASPLG